MQYYIKEPESARASLKALDRMGWLGFDVETTGLDHHQDHLILIQLGNEETQFIYDARFIDPEILRPILEGDQPKVGVNLKFDYLWLKKYGIETEPLYDISLNEKIILAGMVHPKTAGYFSFAGLVSKYCGVEADKSVRTTFRLKGEITEKQLKYAAGDVNYPLDVLKKQIPILEKEGLIPTARLESEALPAFADMEYNGVYLDKKSWMSLLTTAKSRTKVLLNELNQYFKEFLQSDLFGAPIINYASPDQLLFALKKAGFDIKDTSDKTLMFLSDEDLSNTLREFRALSKAITSYGSKYLNYIHPTTGRVHPNINQIGAATGRVSMTSPNLQQQINKEISDGLTGEHYRSCYMAENQEGWLITSDYSGEEIRIMAELSGEPAWVDAFLKGKDLHAVTAWDIFKTKVSKKENPDLRNIMKSINFGTLYGMNYFRLIELFKQTGQDIDRNEAKGILDRYFSKYKEIARVSEEAALSSIEEGYTSTIGGRKRYFNVPPYRIKIRDGKKVPIPKVWDKKTNQLIQAIMRQGKNHKTQGTGSDILKKALVLIRKKLKEKPTSLILGIQVHDEVVLEFTKKANEKEIKEIAKEYVEQPMIEAEEFYIKNIPGEVDTSIGKVWSK